MFSIAKVVFTAVRRGRPGGQHGRRRRARGRVPSSGQHVLEFRSQAHGGRQRLDVVVRKAPTLLAVVARKLGAVDGRHVAGSGRRRMRQTGSVVRGPGKLAVGAPEPVKFQFQLWAAGVVPLRRRRDRLTVRGAAGPVTRRGGWYAIVRRGVDRHLTVSEFSIVTCWLKKRERSTLNRDTRRMLPILRVVQSGIGKKMSGFEQVLRKKKKKNYRSY